MKFLIDMPLSPALAQWLTERGHDAVHAMHLGLNQAPDEHVMEHARIERRIIVTADLDYPRLLALAAADSTAVILFRAAITARRECFHFLERSWTELMKRN